MKQLPTNDTGESTHGIVDVVSSDVAVNPNGIQQFTAPSGNLDGPLTYGIAWTGAMKWLGQMAAWASTLILARILTPSDYGIVGMAALYLALVTYVAEFGIGTAIVTMRELKEEQIAQINSISVMLGISGFLLSLAVAKPIAKFFNSPALPPVIMVMSLPFIINSFQAVPAALLQKEFRFKLLAVNDAIRSVLLAAAMVAFAFMGFRYWALVWGNVLSAAIGTALIVAVKRHSFAIPKWNSIRSALHFSREILIARICWYLYTDSDFLVAGKRLGAVTLGAYTVAWNLASIPMEKITVLFATVTPAFFSAVQHNIPELRRYFLQLSEGVAMLTFPLCIGLSLTVRPFVLVVLGPKWEAAIDPLRLLAIYATLRSVAILIAPVLNAIRESRFNMRMAMASAAVLPLCFYFASRWGATGIAAAWLLVYPVLVAFSFAKIFRCLDLSAGRYARSLGPALIGCTGMSLAVLALKYAEPTGWKPITRLAAEVAIGALFYFIPIWLFYRQRLSGFAGRLRALRALG